MELKYLLSFKGSDSQIENALGSPVELLKTQIAEPLPQAFDLVFQEWEP